MVLNCSKESLQPLLRQQHAEQEPKRWNEKSPTYTTDDQQRQDSVNARRKVSRRIPAADVVSNSICSNSATDDVDSVHILHTKKRVHFAKSRDSSRKKYPRAKARTKSQTDADRGRSSNVNAGSRRTSTRGPSRDQSVLSPNTVRRITNKVNEDAYTIYGTRRRREEPLPASSSRSKTTRTSRHEKKKTRKRHHAKEESIGEECPQLVDLESDKMSTTSKIGSDVATVELDQEEAMDTMPDEVPDIVDEGFEYPGNWESTVTRVSDNDEEAVASPEPSVPNEDEEPVEEEEPALLECTTRQEDEEDEEDDPQECEQILSSDFAPSSPRPLISPLVITIEEPLVGLNDGFLDSQLKESPPSASTPSDWTDISDKMMTVISPSISITSKSQEGKEEPPTKKTNEPPQEEHSLQTCAEELEASSGEKETVSTCIVSSPSLGPDVIEPMEKSSPIEKSLPTEEKYVEPPMKAPHESVVTEKTSIFTGANLPILATGDSQIISEEPLAILQESEILMHPDPTDPQNLSVAKSIASRMFGPYRFAKQRKPKFIYTKRIQRLPPNLQFPDYLFEMDPGACRDTFASRLRRSCAQQKLATRKMLQKLNEFCLPVKGVFGNQDYVSKGYKQNKTSNLRLRNTQIVPAYIVDHMKKFNRPPFCSYVNQRYPGYLVTFS